MSTLKWLLLLLLLEASQLQPFFMSAPDNPGFKTTTEKLILSSMENATAFMEKNLQKTTLISILSLRAVEGQLKELQQVWIKDHLLRQLSQRAENLSKKILIIFAQYISYQQLIKNQKLSEVEPLIQSGFWKFPQTWTHTNASLVYQSFNSSDSSSQKHTAKCIAMLLGTRPKDGKSCSYSKTCKKHVISFHSSDYYLSYQQYYFLLSRMIGCRKKLFKHTQHYMDIFCSNMMDVNQKIEATGYANNTRDLFMKNIVLCGRGGYADFYKLQWLKYILSWQNPQKGCFGTARSCDSHHTILALEALSGFLYASAKNPEAFKMILKFNTLSPKASFL